jgi:hypothetical protein
VALSVLVMGGRPDNVVEIPQSSAFQSNSFQRTDNIPTNSHNITLQSSFEYLGPKRDVGEREIPLVVRHPLLSSSLVDQWTLETRLSKQYDSETEFYVQLRSPTYVAQIPIQRLFLSPVAITITTWIEHLLHQNNGRPNVEDLTITFEISHRGENDASNRFEAIWFSTAVYSPPSGSPTTTKAPISTFGAISDDGAMENTCYVLNKDVFMEFIKQLWPSLAPDRHCVLLFIVNVLIGFNGPSGSPRFKTGVDELESTVGRILENFSLINDGRVYSYVKANFTRLFDFPLRVPAMRSLKIGGNIHVEKLANGKFPEANFDLYHLKVDYNTGADGGEPHAVKFQWDMPGVIRAEDRIMFEFVQPHWVFDVFSSVVVRLVAFNGSELYRGEFNARDVGLTQLNITVPPVRPATFGPLGPGAIRQEQLRGTVVSLSKSCTLKGIVVIQAKASNDAKWVTVATGKSDKDGNFSMAYPYGKFTEARAIFSLSPNYPTTLSATPSDKGESISYDFIYILLQDPATDPAKKEDCSCNPGITAERLPTHQDLIQSNQFTQDVGGGCLHLSVPNRTLREFEYTAIVRHTDPDVANYTLKSVTIAPSGPDEIENQYFYLERGGKVDRPVIDFDHPVQWEDVSESTQTLYQSVTVATGHVLHYRSEFRADGYSLGDLTYTLPLAPGQKKQIVTLESSHTFTGAEAQGLSATERLANSLISDRSIIDQIAGDIGENMFGSSSATTEGFSAAAGGSGSYGYFGGSLGVAGGMSTSSSHAGQNSGRSMSQFFAERLRQGLQQSAASYRQQNSTVVTAVEEGQKYAASTEAIANHNHCHSLTMMYFEVLRHFAIFQELVDVEECVFVPLIMTKFSLENIARWADVLAPRLLPLHANTFIKRYGLYGMQHPLLPAFDAAERVRTRWKTVDYPEGRYCDENMDRVYGEYNIVASFPRPTTRYDNILSLPIMTHTVTTTRTEKSKAVMDQCLSAMRVRNKTKTVTDTHTYEVAARIFDQFMRLDDNFERVPPAKCIRIYSFEPLPPSPEPADGIDISIDPVQSFFSDGELETWRAYAAIYDDKKYVGEKGLLKFMNDFFLMRTISEWDEIWYKNIVPNIFKRLFLYVKTLPVNIDPTDLNSFAGRGQSTVKVAFSGETTLPRKNMTSMKFHIEPQDAAVRIRALVRSQMVFRIHSATIRYTTAHYQGTMFSGVIDGDIIDEEGASASTPLTDAEKRNPRKDDRFLAQRLVTHLNQNLEYYNRCLWYSLDAQRRFLLLDGFKIQTFVGRPPNPKAVTSN